MKHAPNRDKIIIWISIIACSLIIALLIRNEAIVRFSADTFMANCLFVVALILIPGLYLGFQSVVDDLISIFSRRFKMSTIVVQPECADVMPEACSQPEEEFEIPVETNPIEEGKDLLSTVSFRSHSEFGEDTTVEVEEKVYISQSGVAYFEHEVEAALVAVQESGIVDEETRQMIEHKRICDAAKADLSIKMNQDAQNRTDFLFQYTMTMLSAYVDEIGVQKLMWNIENWAAIINEIKSKNERAMVKDEENLKKLSFDEVVEKNRGSYDVFFHAVEITHGNLYKEDLKHYVSNIGRFLKLNGEAQAIFTKYVFKDSFETVKISTIQQKMTEEHPRPTEEVIKRYLTQQFNNLYSHYLKTSEIDFDIIRETTNK